MSDVKEGKKTNTARFGRIGPSKMMSSHCLVLRKPLPDPPARSLGSCVSDEFCYGDPGEEILPRVDSLLAATKFQDLSL